MCRARAVSFKYSVVRKERSRCMYDVYNNFALSYLKSRIESSNYDINIITVNPIFLQLIIIITVVFSLNVLFISSHLPFLVYDTRKRCFSIVCHSNCLLSWVWLVVLFQNRIERIWEYAYVLRMTSFNTASYWEIHSDIGDYFATIWYLK